MNVSRSTSHPDQLVKFRRWATASLVTLVAVIFTGAGVRLSGSGLGCSNWPTCTETSLVPEADIHGVIEYANRLFSFVIVAACIGTLVLARRMSPRQPGFVAKSWWIIVFVLANAVLGGITVLWDLAPSMVMGHYLLTLVPIALATMLVVQSTHLIEGSADVPIAAPRARFLVAATAAWTCVILFLGTVVTAAGPHAGDETAERLDVSLRWAARLHASSVWVLIALLIVTWLSLDAAADRGEQVSAVKRTVRWLVISSVAQGTLGYIQYFTGTPAALAAVHVAISGVIFTIAVRLAMHAAASVDVSERELSAAR